MAYADDVILFLNSKDEWDQAQDILQQYDKASNSKINYKKSTAFPLTHEPIPPDLQHSLHSSSIQWHDHTSPNPILYLGFPIPISQQQINKYYDTIKEKIQCNINIYAQ